MKCYVGVVALVLTTWLSCGVGTEFCHVKSPFYPETGGADVRLTLLTSLRKADGNHCGSEILHGTLQSYVAVAWVIDKLNKGDGFIPGIKFDLQLMDDCENPLYTTRNVLSIIEPSLSQLVTNCTDSNSPVDIGIIGPTRSETAAEAARLMKNSHLPLISPSATAADLSNKTHFPNFFRTALSDSVQIRPVLEILKQLTWTYVVVIHSDDIYGRTAAAMLRSEGRKVGVCFVKSIEVTSKSDRKSVFDDLRAVKEDTLGGTLGVVYFGMWDIAHDLMDFYARNEEYTNTHWLMSESVGTSDNVFASKGSDQNLIGSITLSPSTLVIEELKEFWKNMTETDKIVKKYLDQSDTDEDLMNSSQSDYISAVLDATYAYAVVLKDLHSQKCSNQSGMCEHLQSHLQTEGLLEDIKHVIVNYSSLSVKYVPDEFIESKRYFSFLKETGDINRGSDSILYHINSYVGGSGDNKFQTVGSYSVNGLTLNKTLIKIARDNSMPQSICRGYCKECVDFGQVPMAFLEGDVYILGIFSIHKSDSAFGCGAFRDVSSDTVALEAFIHAVKELRTRTSINYGALAFDDCYSPARLTSIISEYLSSVGTPAEVFGHVIPMNKIVAVVGSLSSGSTIPLARFFSHLNIPVISYAASSPDLDDRVNFPNFLRTVPSDVEQAKAMVEIIVDMGWEYVSILFVNNNYGTKGMQQFQRLAGEARICVSEPKNISENSGDSGPSITTIVDELIEEEAKVVVFFGIDTRFIDFVKVVNEKRVYGKFVIIASEDWGNKPAIIDAGELAARGTITLKLEAITLSPFPTFKDELLTTRPEDNKINPWFGEFWQQEFKCDLKGGFNNIFQTECPGNEALTEDKMKTHLQNQRVSHVQYAVYGAGMGVDVAKSKLCRDFLDEFPCRIYYDSNFVHDVWDSIRQVKNPGQQSFMFDENGNGDIGFTIYNIQKNEDNNQLEYVQVGIYGSRGLKLEKEKMRFYDGIGAPWQVRADCGTGTQCSMCENMVTAIPATSGVDSDTGLSITEIIIIVFFCILVIVIIISMVLCYKHLKTKYIGLVKEIQKVGVRDTDHIYQAVSDRMVYQNRDASPDHRPVPPKPQHIYFVNGSNASLDEDRGQVNQAFRPDDTMSQRNVSGGTVVSTGVTNTSSNSAQSPHASNESASQTAVSACVSPTNSGQIMMTEVPLSYSEVVSNGHVPNGVIASPSLARPTTLQFHQNPRFTDLRHMSIENLSPSDNRLFTRPDLQHMPESYIGSPGSTVSHISDPRHVVSLSPLDQSAAQPHVLLNQHSPPIMVADPSILQSLANQQAALDQQAAYTALELQRLQLLQQNAALSQIPTSNPYIQLSSAMSHPNPPQYHNHQDHQQPHSLNQISQIASPKPQEHQQLPSLNQNSHQQPQSFQHVPNHILQEHQLPAHQQRSPGGMDRPRLRTNPRLTRESAHGSLDSLRSSGRSHSQVLAQPELEGGQENIQLQPMNHESRISRV